MGKYLIDETTLVNIADAIKEKSGKTESIPVTNYATEIANLPGGLPVLYEDLGDVRVIIDYTLNPADMSLGGSRWQYFNISGFEVKNNKIEHYSYRFDVDNTGANGTIEFNACRNTGLEITCMGMSTYDAFQCDIMKVEIKYEDDEEYEWIDLTTDFKAIPADPEEKYIYIPSRLGGGSPYAAIRITVLGSPPSSDWM